MKKLILIILVCTFCAWRADAQVSLYPTDPAYVTNVSAFPRARLEDPAMELYYYWFKFGAVGNNMPDSSPVTMTQPTPAVDIQTFFNGLVNNTSYEYQPFVRMVNWPYTQYAGSVYVFTTLVNTSIDEIRFYDPLPRSILLFNSLGQKVLEADTSDQVFKLPDHLKGVYYYVATANNGSVLRGKVLN